MLGLSFDKLLLIGVLAVIVLGPKRLPHYASQLAKGVKWARAAVQSAQDRVRDEMGEDFDEVDWKKLDPRQYDPRRIIREALLDDPLSAGDADADWHAASSSGSSNDDDSDGTPAPTARPVTALSVVPRQPARRAPRALTTGDDVAAAASDAPSPADLDA